MVAVTEPPESTIVRDAPMPPHGGPLALLRFARRNGMLNTSYGRLALRWVWLKLRWRGRLQTDGLCFVAPDVIVLAHEEDPADENHRRSADNLRRQVLPPLERTAGKQAGSRKHQEKSRRVIARRSGRWAGTGPVSPVGMSATVPDPR